MTTNVKKTGTDVLIEIEGRVDTMTAPELEATFKNELTDATSLELDLAKTEYISSAGLRVFLATQKMMNKQGKMVLKNVRPEVMEVFEVTGFVDILTIE